MRKSAIVACVLSAVLLTGCVSIRVGTEKNPSRLQVKGLATGFVSLDGFQHYSGTILKFGLLSESEGPSEVASVELWPVMNVGVGLVGARIQLLPIHVGLGVLWYKPELKGAHGKAPHAPPPPPAPAPPAPPTPEPPEK